MKSPSLSVTSIACIVLLTLRLDVRFKKCKKATIKENLSLHCATENPTSIVRTGKEEQINVGIQGILL